VEGRAWNIQGCHGLPHQYTRSALRNHAPITAASPTNISPPQIAFVSAQNQISVSWTNNGGSFTLQQTFDLRPPSQWTTVTNAVLTNNFLVATIILTNENAFFRLIAQ